jgi:hypothetical protein
LVVPLLCIVVCAASLSWRGRTARWVAFGVLIVTSVARSGFFIADFWHERATYRSFGAAAATIPPDSVLVTGMGSRWSGIPWTVFWSPPAEYLATEAVPFRVFVPTVFAIGSQHPLVLNNRFAGWRSFFFFASPDDASLSRARIKSICSDWKELGHTGSVMMALVYSSAASERMIPRSLVTATGPGFELVDACRLAP